MRKKSIAIAALATGLSLGLCFNSFAGWEQSEQGWKYKRENGEYLQIGSYFIDGNGDKVAEWYYFKDGIMLADMDIYDDRGNYICTVNENGAMIDENGVVKTEICYDNEAAIEFASTPIHLDITDRDIELMNAIQGIK